MDISMKRMRLLAIIVLCVWSTSAYHLRVNHTLDYGAYKLDYNFTLGQANYAVYQPSGHIHNGGCWNKWINGSNYTWYSYNGMQEKYDIDRGHLAPYADLGDDSCEMNNIVPMNHLFNNGSWRKSEISLRNNYTNYWVACGCKYDWNNFVMTINSNQMLYTIEGCYYVVFSSNPFAGNVEIIANGYIAINSTKTSELPWWMIPERTINSSESSSVSSALWLIILGASVIIMILFAIFIIALPYPSMEKISLI